jgi:hypothetical protein
MRLVHVLEIVSSVNNLVHSNLILSVQLRLKHEFPQHNKGGTISRKSAIITYLNPEASTAFYWVIFTFLLAELVDILSNI